ncbi:hypothetical protein R6Q57_028940 [Mikania cordata]
MEKEKSIFKFPNGGTKVTIKTRPNANDLVVKEWRSQFGDDLPKKIFVKDLVAYIKDKNDAETDKDEGMGEESENLGENLELNEAEKLVEDVAGDCFVTDSKTDS